MKITLAEYMVLTDTLIGSLKMADRTNLPMFKYSYEARTATAKELLRRADEIHLAEIKDEE